MSGVVLRCPACGTTQSHPGECDACSERDVRYFCTNHNPGVWLDEPVCSGCGARFGEAPRGPEPARRRIPTTAARETGRTESPPRVPRRAEPPRPDVRVPPESVTDPEDTAAASSLAELVVDMAEELKRARYRVDEPPSREPAIEAPRLLLPGVGCFVRLVLFVLLLVVLALGGCFMLLSGGF